MKSALFLRRNRTLSIAFFLAFFASVLMEPLSAQVEKGIVTGAVNDATGAAIVSASVTITNLATKVAVHTLSATAGLFVSPPVDAGLYEVKIAAPHLQTVVKTVRVEVGQRIRVDTVLNVASDAQEVRVDATTVQFDTDSSTVSNLRGEKAVHDLPLNGRNYAELLGLGAGVVPGQSQMTSSVPYTMQRGATTYAMNGLRMTDNRLLLDGIGDNENHNGLGVVIFPPIDAIEEFREETANADARYGRTSGGVVNLVFKSGTSQYHGGVFEFLRNASLDAKNYFDSAKPGFRMNSFGATLGGPLWPSAAPKTFFFVDYAGERTSQGLTYLDTVPTWGPEGVGDFSAYSTKVHDPVTLSAFTGNIVSASYLATAASKVGQNVLALYSQYNVTSNVSGATTASNYRYNPQRIDNSNAFDVKINRSFSERDNGFLRYSQAYDDILQPGPLPKPLVGGGVSGPAQQPAHQAVLSETHVFSPTLLNTVRFGWSRIFVHTKGFDAGLNLPTTLGIPGVIQSGDEANTDGLPSMSITGATGIGDPTNSPSQIGTNNYQTSENVSWLKGKHSFDFGAEFLRLQYNIFQTSGEHGVMSFTGNFTGLGLADLLLGAPTTGSIQYQKGTRGFRQLDLGFYAQDNYKVTRRLTLNLGVRYENYLGWPWVEVNNRMYEFIPSLSTTQVYQVGTHGISRSGANANNLNFEPRIGFAYRVASNITLNGGYGLYYAAPYLINSEGPSINAPAVDYWAFNNTSYGATGFNALSGGFTHTSSTTNAPQGAPLYTIDPEAKTPYSAQWHLSLQRQVGANNRFTIAYVGNEGFHLDHLSNINQASPGTSNTTLSTRRPYPYFGQILQLQTHQISNYHSLQLTAERRTSTLSYLVSYTYSHALDESSATSLGVGSVVNSYDLHGDYGNSDLNLPNRFVGSLSYTVPYHGSHRWKPLGDGWQVNAIVSFWDGLPFSVLAGTNTLNIGDSITPRAQLLSGYGNGSLASGKRTTKKWFNTAAFTNPGAQQWGNSGRNILQGPGTKNADFSLFKNIPLARAKSLQLRVETFNLFNTPQFNNPSATVGTSAFGTISSAGSPTTLQRTSREIQLAGKIGF